MRWKDFHMYVFDPITCFLLLWQWPERCHHPVVIWYHYTLYQKLHCVMLDWTGANITKVVCYSMALIPAWSISVFKQGSSFHWNVTVCGHSFFLVTLRANERFWTQGLVFQTPIFGQGKCTSLHHLTPEWLKAAFGGLLLKSVHCLNV